LSQTLDYIKEIVLKDFDWFSQQWKLFNHQRGGQSMDLISGLNERSDHELEEQFLVDRLNRALSRGDVLAMIVGDGIETRLQSFELKPLFTEASLMLKVPDPDGDGPGASVLALEKQGRIYNTRNMRNQLERWGISPTTVDQITSEYWNSLHQIDSRFRADGIRNMAKGQFLPFADVVPKLTDIKNQVGKVVARIRSESDDIAH
jgi:hypothetical protein